MASQRGVLPLTLGHQGHGALVPPSLKEVGDFTRAEGSLIQESKGPSPPSNGTARADKLPGFLVTERVLPKCKGPFLFLILSEYSAITYLRGFS